MPSKELGHGVPVRREHFDGGDIVVPHQALYSLTSALSTAASRRRPVREAPRTESSSRFATAVFWENCVRPWPFCRE